MKSHGSTIASTHRRRFGWIGAALLLAAAAAPLSAARAQDDADPKKLALSEQLLDLAGSKAMIGQILDQVAPGLTQLIEQANPGKEAEVEDVMTHYVMPKMKDSLPEAMHECAAIYARHFSTDELSQLVAFYQSPIGRKLVQEQPQMGQELAGVGAAWARAAAVQAVRDYADEFRKRGLQTPI